MTIYDFAALLDGRQYREEITVKEEQTARENGFIVIYGASDDLCEIAGAVHDELGCFDGGEFHLYNSSVVNDDVCADENYRVKVIWNPDGTWTYETQLPHAEFKIYEDDELYCIGIVVDIKSTYPPKITEIHINDFAAKVHENAVDHGWWEDEKTFPEIIALCHSELSEALEEYRNGRPNLYYPCRNGFVCVDDRAEENTYCGSRTYDPNNPNAPCEIKSKKPEGIAVELADCIIRILDYCAFAGIDIEKILREKHEFNKSRPYKHGGKRC